MSSEPLDATVHATVHATVRAFDAATRSGTVLLDDGLEIGFDATAFDAGHTLFLRLGQRVRLTRDAGGAITQVAIATIPDPA